MFYDDVAYFLSSEYRSGKTYQEIADEHGLSFGYIRDLISGRRRIESMSLSTFFKLFPRAEVTLFPAQKVSPSNVASDAMRRELDLEREKLAAERRELDAVRRELSAERRLLELERAAISPRAPLSSSYQPEESEVKV